MLDTGLKSCAVLSQHMSDLEAKVSDLEKIYIKALG